MEWALLLVVPFVVALVTTVAIGEITGRRRERIDIEAHEAYMNGGGYLAYWAVYEKYGITRGTRERGQS